jgi:hypothetical protein
MAIIGTVTGRIRMPAVVAEYPQGGLQVLRLHEHQAPEAPTSPNAAAVPPK